MKKRQVFSLNHFNTWPTSHYVWNIALGKGCDVVPGGNPINPNHDRLADYVVPEKLKEGDIIWIHPEDMTEFVRTILPKIRTCFILLLNDSDLSFPKECLASEDASLLLNSRKLIHLFAQNCDSVGHPKCSPIPLGHDFHTVLARPHIFNEPYQTVEEQEATLNLILKELKPTSQRRLGALCDFQLNLARKYDEGGRFALFLKLRHLPNLHWLQDRIQRRSLWRLKGEYAFSISPHGWGMDCHRTWEDLTLGCIVIVKTSPLDSLYEGLPVVIVQDWLEISGSNMRKWLKKYADAFTNPEYRKRLTRMYWMSKIQLVKSSFLKNQSRN